MVIKSENAEAGQSCYRNWTHTEHLSIITDTPTCGKSKCIFNASCKIYWLTCFQREERIQDTYGLFCSGSISFSINTPRKTVRKLILKMC